jgi:hypothetical protein
VIERAPKTVDQAEDAIALPHVAPAAPPRTVGTPLGPYLTPTRASV